MTDRCSFKKTIAYVGFVLYFLLLLRVAVLLETHTTRAHGDSLAPVPVIRSASERPPFDPSIPSSPLLTWPALA